MEAVKVIYNNDVKVIDYLADLKDRRVIKQLQRFIRQSRSVPICILHACPADSLVAVILYKAPMDLNEKPNNLIVFTCGDLMELYGYFDRWFKRTSENNKNVYDALDEIIGLLAYELVKEYDNNALTSFMG